MQCLVPTLLDQLQVPQRRRPPNHLYGESHLDPQAGVKERTVGAAA